MSKKMLLLLLLLLLLMVIQHYMQRAIGISRLSGLVERRPSVIQKFLSCKNAQICGQPSASVGCSMLPLPVRSPSSPSAAAGSGDGARDSGTPCKASIGGAEGAPAAKR